MHEPDPTLAPGAEGAPTLTGAERPATLSAFPAPGWDRYQPVRLLGEGGMGRVFLAYDPRLGRDVALKFVRGDDLDLMRRFQVEARAQARVDHPHVCKVYEVGEVAGRGYIAMQYVAGQPLSELARVLTIEQKVAVIKAVAEGVHAAHRLGVIHRDIKPSNIMVARGPDQGLVPYLMDFGLAREPHAGRTVTGAVLGTPGYMSPEQARGVVGNLDRRTDVYSLGATLYRVLSGALPIPGSGPVEILAHLATAEPRPLRAIDPDIPADLEAIALTCLEKERTARYESARALAEDLGRFLDGEPVRARATGFWYRLGKRARKHRLVLTVAAVGALLLALALGWVGVTRRDADRRADLAQRFTEAAERIEATARYAALAPLHHTGADGEALRARMEALSAEIARAGRLAPGPGNYALGRGYYALGDLDRAQERLETAWAAGYRAPRAAYAMTLVLGRRYHQALLAAERLPSQARREAARRDAIRRYREPALAYLRRSEGAAVPSTEYLAALLAYYEDRLDDALAHLRAARARLPWFYEAPLLEGDIWLARALRRWNHGRREAAEEAFAAGRAAYARAAAIAESLPAVHTAMAGLEYAALRVALYGRGDELPAFERGIAAVERALVAAPRDVAAHVLASRLYRRLAELRMRTEGDVERALARSITAAEFALLEAPERADARLALARARREEARYALDRGRDPRPALERAAAAFEAVPDAERDYEYHADRALVFSLWADDERGRGGDAGPLRERAIASLRAAVELDPEDPVAWINLGRERYKRASQPGAEAPERDLERARQALDEARRRNPEHLAPYFYAGQVSALAAERARAQGRDPEPHLAHAVASYRGGVAINERVPPLHNGLGLALLQQAEVTWARGGDPTSLAAAAEEAFERAVEIAPARAGGYNNLGMVREHRASWRRAEDEDPTNEVRAAQRAYRQALERMPEQPAILANLAEVSLLLAEWALAQGTGPERHLGDAGALIEAALARNRDHVLSWRLRGEQRALAARARLRRRADRAGADEEARPDPDAAAIDAYFAESVQSFENALRLSPDDLDARVGLAGALAHQAAWLRARGRAYAPIQARGLTLIDGALRANPAPPRAQAVRERLRAARSR